jgi:hypothetical protein
MPRRFDIEGLAWDDENERHVEEHIDATEIDDLIEGRDFVVFRNTSGHPSNRWRVIGRTTSGMFVTAILEEPRAGAPTLWRPVTGWRSTAFERDLYRQERNRIVKKRGRVDG